jgi:hypothetical protein
LTPQKGIMMSTEILEEKTLSKYTEIYPISIICEEDEQEAKFDELVKLWIEDKIEFSQLMDNYPDFNASMIEKIIKKINKLIRRS